MRLLSRIFTQLVLRLMLTLAFGALLLVMQGRLPLTAAMPGGDPAPAPPGTVDPQAEADRVARALADLAGRLRDGTVYDAAPVPTGSSPATAAPAPVPGAAAPHFTAVRGTPAQDTGSPRILNGGGAGSFHRAP